MPEIVAQLNVVDGGLQDAATPEVFKIFLIEEPELYLHPQAERARMIELQQLSTKPQTQVVLCTHSAFFVDLQGQQSIVRFARANRAKTEVFGWTGATLTQGEKAWLNTLRFFDGGATSMLFADCAVLCEGATEKLCVPKIAQDLNVFDSAFEIVDCNGSGNIQTYQKVLESLKVPYVIWVDGDEDKPEAKLHAAQKIADLSASKSAIGAIVVNRHDWEDAAGMPAGKNSEKPLRSWTKFVANGDACPAPLAKAIQAVYARQDLDLRTPPV
jgi:CRISPR-associated exonuclease Cas4